MDESVLLYHRFRMLKFSKILMVVCRKIFFVFYPILNETFSNRYGLPLSFVSSPRLYGWIYFCSISTDLRNLSFLFHQKFPLLSYNLKNVLTKQFLKMQKQPFANVLQNRCSYKFPDIHKKISVLKSLVNTVRSLKACNFSKKETPI